MAKFRDVAQRGESCTSPLGTALLDSSLIVTTNKESYNTKIIQCGDYVQVYRFNNNKLKINQNLEKNENIKNLDTDNLIKNKETQPPSIEIKNINRSKFECQRLARSNEKEWKSFITITFKENITDIEFANKKFRNFIDVIKRKKKDFKYIGIPEFQKRGAIHYHVLTNIDVNDNDLMYIQKDNLKYKHIKYWNHGFSSVEEVKGDIKKVVGYLSKYMTKDIDNRLFSKHRYFYSRNLIKPKVSYYDTNNKRDNQYLIKILGEKKLIYNNVYQNQFNNENIIFEEYL